ncbi:kif1-binding protein homolog [Stylonychia lemnae]|uniref:KIF-binding protein n=1 Tax=Stylonychia lemnae TaxID=5949 RepID=A0A078AGL3_STYLE|nr:kif1-binding protein homolog [Stylonychia lemnae]|eukprot:CDW81364.1 kif1-binding protein homolog [Stylonychia lemnae]
MENISEADLSITTESDPLNLPQTTQVDNQLKQSEFWNQANEFEEQKQAVLKHTNELQLDSEAKVDQDQLLLAVELTIWLHTEYQAELEECQKLMDKLNDDESKPFLFKYQAREKYKKLLENDYLNPKSNSQQQSQIIDCATAIVKFKLGLNFFDCEEYSDAEVLMRESLEVFDRISDVLKIRYFNTIQDIYNNIGITYCNRGSHEKGIPYLLKAEQIYKMVVDSTENTTQAHNTSLLNDFDQYLLSQIEQSQSKQGVPLTQDFAFYINGGIDKSKLEKNYTLTLFYMAQVYTKLGQNEKAVQFCADTMKRQLAFKEYDVKDWAVNCINLSEYFIKNGHFAQAEYCLFAGVSILPGDLSKKRKLRATLQMQLARYYLERLVFGVQNYVKNNEAIPEIVERQFVLFPELQLKFPHITDINDIEQAKLLFRLANTQFKKAMDYYVLDGYVTEHIQMKQDLSKLYKHLAIIEPNAQRVFAMQDRRRELLEAIIKDINPKAYEVQVIELEAELSDIFSSMFDIKYDEIKQSPKAPKKADFDELNQIGQRSIYYSHDVVEIIMKKEEKFDYLQAVVNIQLSVARIYSKLYDKSKQKQVQYLESSFREYEKLKKFTIEFMKEKNITSPKDLPQGVQESYQIMLEMYELLPVKISKINAQIHQQS